MTDKRTIILSDKAVAIMNTPAQVGMIEDIYTIGERTWFPVTVMPNMERKVEAALTSIGVEAYCPLSADWRKQSRREKHMRAAKVRIERPLFVGYLFVAMPDKAAVYAMMNDIEGLRKKIHGFRDFLRDTARPDCPRVAVNAEVVETLRRKQEDGAFDATVKKGKMFIPKWLKENMSVRIKDGPLAQFSAMLMKVLPNDMVRLEVMLFGRSTKTDVAISNVEVA